MNSLRFEIVQQTGEIQLTQQANNQRKAKCFMKTPCNHKYHVQCLKKWMEVRLECPACRQQLPILEDDD
ncbi:hypothetical protein FGO68_gene2210 [Halteria grandinella]|uniref:RING-type domain-containing protein n=1 Tax=Halteria grandinella TaxID=5974 RepID=A0A8J8NB35_HALGN|nr:hypothetical protein FGO68_gene2210 [Halteria grandinella]